MASGTRRILVELLGDERSLERAFGRSSKQAVAFGATLRGVTRSTGGFSRGFLSGAGALSSFGGALALTSGSFFAGAGLVAGLKASVGAAADFQQTMNVLQQQTGATADELASASLEARKLGADITLPATSASDAAQAMLQLAKGGLTLKEAMAATRGTLQLAAAAQTDVATAANQTARALTTFALSGSNAGKIADLLANGAASATGDITDFALALSQSGTSAHQFGLTATDTVAAITELAKAGILGSDAGTSLRVMLTRLLPTSKAAQRTMTALGVSVKDSSGNFLPFRDIVNQYAESLAKLPPAQRQFALQTIFGTDAQRAANIILQQGVSTFDSLSSAVSRQGGAAKRAAAQQKGFKGALDGFNSALQTTEVTVGTALLPVLTKYLRQASTWLGTTEHQEEIQRKVTTAVSDTTTVLKDVISGVRAVTGVFGGFKETLELIIALKFASKITSYIAPLARFAGELKKMRDASKAAGAADGLGATTRSTKQLAKEAKAAEAKAAALRLTLGRLAAIGVITIGIELFLHRKQIENTVDKFLSGHNLGFLVAGKIDTSKLNLGNIDKVIEQASKAGSSLQIEALERYKEFLVKNENDFLKKFLAANTKAAADHRLRRGSRVSTGPILNLPPDTAGAGGAGAGSGSKLTAEQRNTFFDNSIARILQRGGLGDIGKQISAIDKASALITQRIARTKDVTRKLNLEDQLLELGSQRSGLRQQQMQSFLEGLQFNVDKAGVTASLRDDLSALQALQAGIQQQIKSEGKTLALQQQLFQVRGQIADARKQQRDRQQFGQLGLGPTGDERTPLVPTLKRQLSNVSSLVEGTFLDTSKTRSVLANIKKVLSAGIGNVSAEVRSKVKDMLDGIDQQLKDHEGDNSTRFHKANVNKLLRAAGLSPDEIRAVSATLSQVGAGGTIHGSGSGAFGMVATTVNTNIDLDGKRVAQSTTKHQQQRNRRNPQQKRGPFAGPH